VITAQGSSLPGPSPNAPAKPGYCPPRWASVSGWWQSPNCLVRYLREVADAPAGVLGSGEHAWASNLARTGPHAAAHHEGRLSNHEATAQNGSWSGEQGEVTNPRTI